MERRSERIFGQRYGFRPVKISDLNLHLMCVLCSGYYIDATTIIECLHSFCRSCIVRYLETCGRCPICDVLVHKAQPMLNIRLDHVLQGLVYKLVPGLLTKEMNSRREFYTQGLMSRRRDQPQEDDTMTTQSESTSEDIQQRPIRTQSLMPADSESLSISLEYLPNSKVSELRVSAQDAESRVSDSATDVMDLPLIEYADIRYLLCPAGFTVRGLKKFIRAKFDLPLVYQIDIFHGDECLANHFSMLDVAFIFQWQKRAPLHLRYSVSYVPRTKRKLASSNSSRRQNSKENETLQGEPNKNDEKKRTSGQQEPTKSQPSICPSKTPKHANSRTRPVDGHRKSTLRRGNGSMRSKRTGNGVIQNKNFSVSSGGNGSGHRDIGDGEEHRDKTKETLRKSGTEDDSVMFSSISTGNAVSRDVNTVGEKYDERISEFVELSERRTQEETEGQTASMTQISENIVSGMSESAELTIDLTGEDLSSSVATLLTGEADEVTSVGDIPNGVCPEVASRVVGSITFVGNGSATMLSGQESVLCSVGQNSVNGDVAKCSIALPCFDAFKTLSCGLHGHHLGYASDAVGESIATDDVMKIISTPEVTIMSSFGVQLIYSPDSIVSQNPICGVIQLPEAPPISANSNALTMTPTWSHGEVATNGIINDTDFLRLCEGGNIRGENDFGGCYEQFVMPNIMEGVGTKMSDDASLGYAVSLDPTVSGPLPCVFVAQGTSHQAQNLWSLPGSSKDAETVDWGLCYPVSAAELGAASLVGISDERCLETQPEGSFICVTSSALPEGIGGPWAHGPYTDRNGMVEVTQTVLGVRGEPWPVESRQAEPRAVKMCIVEPQAVKRKADNDLAVEAKEAKTSYAESNAAKTWQARQPAAETDAEGNTAVEPQTVEAQTVGLSAVEHMPELLAVEATVEPTVEPQTMGPMALDQGSRETVTEAVQETEATSLHMVEGSAEEPQGAEAKPMQLSMLSRFDQLAEPLELKAVTSVTVEQPTARSPNTVDAYPAEESLVEPDDVELTVTARASTLEKHKLAERRETSVNCRTVEDQAYSEYETRKVYLNSIPMVESSLIASLVDSGSPREVAEMGRNQEETSILPQNRHTTAEVHSMDCAIENAIPGNSVEQPLELPIEEKLLFSGDYLAKVEYVNTNWSDSKEEKQPTSDDGKKEPTSESTAGPEGVDDTTIIVPKTEEKTEDSSASLEDEAASLSTKPEDISYKVEDESVSFEDEQLVIDMMEQRPVSAKAEDVLTPSVDVTDVQESVFPLNDSYSHLSKSMLSSSRSEAIHCSSAMMKLSISAAAEHVPVSIDAINCCLVSAEILVSDPCNKTTALDDGSMAPIADSCSKTTASDSCSKTTASDSCSNLPNSDSCSKTTASDECDNLPISDSRDKGPVPSVDTGVWLVADGMFVSVTDDYVMVCVGDDEAGSGAEDGNSTEAMQIGIDAKEMPVVSDDSGTPVLKSGDDMPGTYSSKQTLVSEACNGILDSDASNMMTASDDCSKCSISDSCNKITTSDDGSEVPRSDTCSKTTASDDDIMVLMSDSCNKIPTSDDCKKVTDSYSCSKTTASDDCSMLLYSADSCNKIPSPDDCSNLPISDYCNKIPTSDDGSEAPLPDSHNRPAEDVCDEVEVSISTPNPPISALTDQTAVSNAEEADLCISKDTSAQNRVLFDETQVPNTTSDDLLSCISNDLPVSIVPDKVPVPVIIAEGELTKSSACKLCISVPIPTIPNNLPINRVLAEHIPVSLASSLENLPVCSSSLEAAPFSTSLSVESNFCQPLAVSSLAGGYSDHVAIENQVMSTGEGLEEEVLSCYISSCDLDTSQVAPVSQENSNSAPSGINLRRVEMTLNDDCTVEERTSEHLDFTDEIKTNSTDVSLITDGDVVPSSVPLECDDGESTAVSISDQKDFDMENLGQGRFPGCELKVIGSHVDAVTDRKSVDNGVNLLLSGDSIATCGENKERNEDKEKGDLELSPKLLCSGSFIREDEERHDHFRSIAPVTRSFSFSHAPSGCLGCAVPPGSRRWRSRSLDESIKPDSVELQSSGVQLINRVLLEENTALLNIGQDTVELLSDEVSSNCIFVCDNERRVHDELTVLNPSDSCVDDVPVLSFRIEPLVTNTKEDADAVNISRATSPFEIEPDTVNVSNSNDVGGINDERADTCKFIVPVTIAFCDASCDNLKSNDVVSE